jgi:hypothetical protein
MEEVRYKPGEAIRWLQTGAQDIRQAARRHGKSFVRREGERSIGRDLRDMAGVLTDLGKSALAELAHRQAEASEYVLHDSKFEIVAGGRIKTLAYTEVKAMKMRGDRTSLILDQGSVTIKPHAYVIAGRLKVPVGWARNGIEVPFELLIDELSARCGLDIEREA